MKPIPVVCTSKQLMRIASLLLLSTCAFAGSAQPSTQLVLPKAPVRFEARPGAGNRPAEWSARGMGYSLVFTKDATRFQFADRDLSMRFMGADPGARFEASAPFSVPTQYFTPAYTGPVESYRRLRRRQVYPGVDVVYYGTGGNLEYDFEIAPGADPSRIRLRFAGADRIRMSLNGDLVFDFGTHSITQKLPVVYQRAPSGARKLVYAAYQLEPNRDVTLRLDPYDTTAPLVIDPVVTLAAFLNGSTHDTGVVIAHDAQGFLYVAGNATSPDFNSTPNAFFGVNRGAQNTWLMKLNPSAASGDQVIVYSTLFGGTAADTLKDMAVDSATGLVYMAGATTSTDLLVTGNALQSTNAGSADGFVAVFDPQQFGSASLLYGTYLGGAAVDEPLGIATRNGKVYVTGATASLNFPTANSVIPSSAGGTDMFITELDPTKSGSASLVASGYYGGSNTDFGTSVAVDSAGLVYVVGITYSIDLPMTAAPYQGISNGGGDAFIVEFALEQPLILHSTYLGGSGTDGAKKILIDPAGRVAVAGYTSSANFPITQNAYQPLLGGAGATNAFLAILDLRVQPQALVYSTFFGGSVGESITSLRLDPSGIYYLGGYTLSPNLPVSQGALNPVSSHGGIDGFVALINPSAPPLNSLVYSSYITGPGSQVVFSVDFDAAGSVYVTGYATSNIFPAGQQIHSSATGFAQAFILRFTR